MLGRRQGAAGGKDQDHRDFVSGVQVSRVTWIFTENCGYLRNRSLTRKRVPLEGQLFQVSSIGCKKGTPWRKEGKGWGPREALAGTTTQGNSDSCQAGEWREELPVSPLRDPRLAQPALAESMNPATCLRSPGRLGVSPSQSSSRGAPAEAARDRGNTGGQ